MPFLLPTYILTVFVGAFLLFQVQPLIAKYILPWFGGGPAIWTTAMLFFQVVLLAGYAYAHLTTEKLAPRAQALLHLALLAAALVWLPITPADAWQPTGSEAPTARILLLLAASIGLPYLVLSSTAPLLQAWFARDFPGRSPYRLYALSNLGSLLALVSYPFVVEPRFTRTAQTGGWSVAFGVFAVLCGLTAVPRLRGPRAPTASDAEADDAPPRPAARARALWLALAAFGSILFLAVTNQITMDVAVIPFLWVLPLGLYLLTFVLAFEHEGWYSRPWWVGALYPALAATVWFMFRGETPPVGQQLVVYSAMVLVGCMVCHGELARLKPHPRHLTSFYLTVALGGALGGAFVALGAPVLFNDYLELHVALLGVATLAFVSMLLDPESRVYLGRAPVAAVGFAMTVAALSVALSVHASARGEDAVVRTRSFYGALTVTLENAGRPDEHLELAHGRIPHGMQFTDLGRRRIPVSYYAPNSGVGQMFEHLETGRPRRIGMVGMGVGSVAAYARPGDSMRIYEINPDIRALADTLFTYLEDSGAEIEVVLGDARLSLDREPPQAFDVLVLDAFSGDAIPVHLLTEEAFELYDRHLAPDGVIAILVSTWHLDLGPVVRRAASELGFQAIRVVTYPRNVQDWGSDWMILTRDEAWLEGAPFRSVVRPPPGSLDEERLWTDDYTSLFQVLDR